MTKDFDWLEKHLKPLLLWGRGSAKTWPDTRNEFGPWTCLKLIALKYHVDPYTTIMNARLSKPPRLPWSSLMYVDIFAGSGLNKIRDTGDFVAGSTIVAEEAPTRRKFDFILAIENNADYSRALAKRLGKLRKPESFHVVGYPAEDHVDTIERHLQKLKAHYLAFVDYEGAKGFSWRSMERLLRHRGDLFITFIPSVVRNLGEDRKVLAELVGERLATEVTSYEELYEGYLEQIRGYRPNTLDIRIRSGGGYHYMLIFCAGQKRNPQWFEILERLKGKIEELDGDDVVTALHNIQGRAPRF